MRAPTPDGGLLVAERVQAPVVSDAMPEAGDHDRMTHIVLEGWRPEEGDFIPAGTSVAEGIIEGVPVRSLCGKRWVPSRDPKRFPVCPTCKEVAEANGWKVPA